MGKLFENSYKRVDADHVLDLFVGKNELGCDSLLFVFENDPAKSDMHLLKSSQVIDMQLRRRSDDKYALVATLKQVAYEDLFERFVTDIIESSRYLTTAEEGIGFISRRYANWQVLFRKQSKDLLSEQEIKGLIGELLLLKCYMIPKYGVELAVESWTGCNGSDQDFRIDDIWYEVKNTSVSNPLIKISSIEQLDSDKVGYLCVFGMDKTSRVDANGITLNSIVRDLMYIITDPHIRNVFRDKLLLSGYCEKEEYDDIFFDVDILRTYKVDSDFPAIRRSDVKYQEIINAEYVIDVSGLLLSDPWGNV